MMLLLKKKTLKKLIADAATFGGGKVDAVVNAAGVISLQGDDGYNHRRRFRDCFSILM